MVIRFTYLKSTGNGGHGLVINGDQDVEIHDGVIANNGGDGVRIGVELSLIERLGLPRDTSPRELAELLAALQYLPPERRQAAVESSGMFKRWSALGTGAISLGANIVTMAGADNVGQLIKTLLGQA